MNCIQAQVMLAAHREVKNGEVDTSDLDEHLEQCSSCRQVLARYSLIGQQIRTLPSLEPAPDLHTKLMKTLANEHARFIQQSTSAPPPPAFLKPYLREHVSSSQGRDAFVAFSAADTGPLPVIRAVRKKRRSYMSQFAVMGLVAVFFMALMMGGITSLLLVAHDNVPGRSGSNSINKFPDVASTTYTTSTAYQHVVSAVAGRASIYYTAYGDGSNDEWMLEQLDRLTKVSSPLLPTASPGPMIVLGSKNGWLVWLQFDAPKTTDHRNLLRHPLHSQLQIWSLHTLSLVPQEGPAGMALPNKPVTSVSDTFDQEATPNWVRSPVQGIWFVQNSLLVAMIDSNGISHLMQYTLNSQGKAAATIIATARPDHIFTSPTANSDGTQIYWADEWRTDDDNLHSNIWMQQTLRIMPAHGQLVAHTKALQQLFRQDGTSFRPVVVNETIFWLNSATETSNTTQATTPNSTPAPAITPNTNSTSIPTTAWTGVPLDNNVRGSLLMLRLNENPATSPVQVNTAGLAYALQAGTDFVLWQTDAGYGMFDATTKSYITVADDANNAEFLTVNGDAAVWTANTAIDTTPTAKGPVATLMAFNWPRK
ncbi:MAG: hypothetical protein NVS4B7_02900 [Ktedonobacteraceae bacterium]